MHAKDRALSSARGSGARSAVARASVRPDASGACAGSAGAGASDSTSTSGAGARSAAAEASATTSAFGATAGSARGQASASTSAGGAAARSAGGGGLCEHQRERSKCKACREDADEAMPDGLEELGESALGGRDAPRAGGFAKLRRVS